MPHYEDLGHLCHEINSLQPSFHPETALFRRGCVNLRAYLCDVKYYVLITNP